MGKWKSLDKYSKINKCLDIIGIVLVMVLVVMTFIYWMEAPEVVPTHYNFKGEIDGYGSKNTLFILPPIAVITYIGIAILAKFPNIYNYPIEITPRNKERQYIMASIFIRVINVETLAIFFYIQITTGYSMNNSSNGLSLAFLPISLFVLFGSIGFYIHKSIKYK